MKKIITISREFGAGGSNIGKAVARKLGYEYYDKAIILDSAKASNIDVESFVKWDETVPTEFGFAQSLFDFYNKPLNERLFAAQSQVIRKVAEKGNCVIVGRNANAILREFDYTLHVFLHATPYWRMQYLKTDKMKKYSESEITERINSVDKKRRKYCSYYTNTDFGMADYYDICLDTGNLGIDTCVDIICEIANKEEK